MFTILVDVAKYGFIVRQSCPWQTGNLNFDDHYTELRDAIEGARLALKHTLDLGGACEGVKLSASVSELLGYCPPLAITIWREYRQTVAVA